MNVVETISDLRCDERAERFWKCCARLIECTEVVATMAKRPCRKYDFNVELHEAIRQWRWCNEFRRNGFKPPKGEDILVNANTWRPISGTHRASALYVLDHPVPALLVEIKQTRRYEWVFESGMWKWRA